MILCSAAFSARADVQYIYDELGRLTTVVAPSGERADYSYDAAGNITSIQRSLSAVLSISEFTPNVGQAGNVVTILGSGFSATLANNIVRFNGTTAVVTTAGTKKLTVTVPAGGTTGPISVTVGGNTVTSNENFTYSDTGAFGPPTITSITPEVGAAGSQVTIVGTNFDLAPGATRVEFEGPQLASIVSMTATQIVAVVPSNSGTGPIRVVTPRGIATSAEFYIVPAGYVYADIVVKRRANLGGAAVTLNINATPNKHGLMLFTAQQGQYVSVQIDSLTATGTVAYKIFTPNNVQLDTGSLYAGGPRTIHVPALPKSGTYSILFSPGATAAQIVARVKADEIAGIDDVVRPLSALLAGQSQRMVIPASQGQKVSVGLSGLTTSNDGGLTTYVYRPDGTYMTNTTCYPTSPGGGCGFNLWTTATVGLPVSGTYTIVFSTTATQSITGGTLTVSSDKGGALTAGTVSNLNITRAGQNGRFTFNGTNGQAARLTLDNPAMVPTNLAVVFKLYRADGTQLATASATTNEDGAELYIPSLPATETYTVLVDPEFAATGTMSVTLNGALDIVIDGPSVAVAPSPTPGYGQRLRFNGVAGQKVGIGLSGLTASTNAAVTMYLYKPDGVYMTNVTCYPTNPGGGCHLNAWATIAAGLPATGMYTIVLTPSAGQSITTGALTVSSDTGGALIAGTASNLNITRAGQNGRFTFNAGMGQSARVSLDNPVTAPANLGVGFRLYRADGAQLATATATPDGDGAELYVASLPATGTYTVLVDPDYAATGTMSVTLNGAGDIAIDGASVAVTSPAPGYSQRLRFSGLIGQKVGIGLSGLTTSNNASITMYVYKPDGAYVNYATCYPTNPGGACNLNAWATATAGLPATGTYTIVLVPSAGQSITAGTLTVSSDKGGVLTAGNAANLNIARTGQNGRYTFAGTTGQAVSVTLDNLVTAPLNQGVAFKLYRADGTQLATAIGDSEEDGAELYFASLPATETYTVLLDPDYAATGTMSVTLNGTMEIAIDGSAVTVTPSPVPGYGQRVRFSGTVGQKVGIGLSGLATSNNSGINLYVYKPDGAYLTNAYCTPTSPGGGCNINVWTTATVGLPATGLYTIVLDPAAGQSVTGGTLRVSSDKGGALTPGTASNLNITRTGQNGRFTFNGTAGQAARVYLDNPVTTPTNLGMGFRLYRADGTQMAATTATPNDDGAELYVASLPGTETYTVLLDPDYAATLTASVTLNGAADIAIDGSSVAVTPSPTPSTGQRLRFNGTIGQKVGIGLNGLTTSNNAGINVYVYKPDGAYLISTNCTPTSPGAGCNLNAWSTTTVGLPATGPYTIVLVPSAGQSITAGSLTVSTDTGGALTSGTASNLSITRAGQNGRFTFDGTTGQAVSVNLDNLATAPLNQGVGFRLYRADGTQLATVTARPDTDGAELSVASLPATESYTVLVDPDYAATGTMSVTLNGAADLVIDGSTVALAPSPVPGYGQRLRFSGTIGQKVGIGLNALTTSNNAGINMYVYKPDGAYLTSTNCAPTSPGGGCSLDAWTTATVGLPATGMYTIVLTPSAGQSITAGTLRASSDAIGAITIGGPTATHATTKPGQNGRFTFTGTANASYNLLWSASTFPGTWSYLYVYKPDGSQLTNIHFDNGNNGRASGSLPLTNVPVDGTYTILVDPYAAGVGQVTLRLQ